MSIPCPQIQYPQVLILDVFLSLIVYLQCFEIGNYLLFGTRVGEPDSALVRWVFGVVAEFEIVGCVPTG